MSTSVDTHEHPPAFRHDAFLYEDGDEFLTGAMAFAAAALAAGEPLIVALEPSKIVLLKSELGSHAEAVQFVDVRVIGANPARLIPAWRRSSTSARSQARACGASASRCGLSAARRR